MKPSFPAALLVLTALASSLAAQRASPGRLYELFVVDGPIGARCSAVNARGRATGVLSGAPSSTAFVWRAASGALPLAPLAGFSTCLGTAIDRDGFVLGASLSGSVSEVTLWSPAGTALGIPGLPGGTLSSPLDLADGGLVLGTTRVNQVPREWIWDAVNGTRELSTLGLPAGAHARGLSPAGLVCGSFGEALLLDPASGTTTVLGTLGGSVSGAVAANDAGHVVGWSGTALTNDPSPFFWEPGSGMRSLGTPAGAGNVQGQAVDVDEHDRVVGFYTIAPSHEHAFVWEASLGMRDLNDLVRGRGGVELTQAFTIAGTGWIAGNAVDHAAGGRPVGFVLKPL